MDRISLASTIGAAYLRWTLVGRTLHLRPDGTLGSTGGRFPSRSFVSSGPV